MISGCQLSLTCNITGLPNSGQLTFLRRFALLVAIMTRDAKRLKVLLHHRLWVPNNTCCALTQKQQGNFTEKPKALEVPHIRLLVSGRVRPHARPCNRVVAGLERQDKNTALDSH